jgi:hypothetical protein
MPIEPSLPRYKLEQTPVGIRAVMPARWNLLLIIILALWLVGWTWGQFTVISLLSNPNFKTPRTFLIVWVLGWTIGGAMALLGILWQLFGKEILAVEDGTLTHRIDILGFGRSRVYSVNRITQLHTVDHSPNMFRSRYAWAPPLLGTDIGPIVFDYGARTIHLAQSLDEAEARMLIAELLKYMPNAVS